MITETKKNKYEDSLYIKDGNFMQKDENGDFYPIDYISVNDIKKRLSEIIEDIENVKKPNLNSLIMKAIKEVTDFKKVSHCKIPSKNPNSKVKYDDPLYAEFVSYIQNLPAYQDHLTHSKKLRKSINERRSAAQKAKKTENDFFDMCIENKYRRIRRRNKKK